MTLITDTETLSAFCERHRDVDFIAVDTEFMRDTTYWPRLCLIQVAGPEEVVAIDPLAGGIDLAPFLDLMNEAPVHKVFHAARQDVEILFQMSGTIPRPLFDTQVAAMVCGFGDSVGYETLVTKLAGGSIDKSSRFTDWAQRPLTDKQLTYALADVIHLRPIYETLAKRVRKAKRLSWLEQEMAILTDPATYSIDPDQAYRRIKARSTDPRFLAILRAVAAWREREAQKRDVPRNRILRDDALMELAAQAPETTEAMGKLRGISKGYADGRAGQDLQRIIAEAKAIPRSQCPSPPTRQPLPEGLSATVDMFKLLLKIKCDEHDVAAKLVANTADLEAIAMDDNADVPALKGWRREVFGDDALAVKQGRVAIALNDRKPTLIPVETTPAIPDDGGATTDAMDNAAKTADGSSGKRSDSHAAE